MKEYDKLSSDFIEEVISNYEKQIKMELSKFEKLLLIEGIKYGYEYRQHEQNGQKLEEILEEIKEGDLSLRLRG